MRISDQSRQNSQLQYMRDSNARMDIYQQQLATQKRIQRPSDDPTGAASAISYRTDIDYESQMRRNIQGGLAFLNVTESALTGVTEGLQRLRELTVKAASDTLGPDERRSIASEVDQLTRQMVQLGNTNFNGAYIFSGHKTTAPAYVSTGEPPTAVAFQGDAGQRLRRISKEDTVPVNVTGAPVFGNIFADLIQLRQNLESNAPAATIQGGLSGIDAALDRVLVARADVGARVNRFDSTTILSENTDLNLQELSSDVENVDLTEAIVRINAQQTALQAALGAIGKSMNMTLLNYMS